MKKSHKDYFADCGVDYKKLRDRIGKLTDGKSVSTPATKNCTGRLRNALRESGLNHQVTFKDDAIVVTFSDTRRKGGRKPNPVEADAATATVA